MPALPAADPEGRSDQLVRPVLSVNVPVPVRIAIDGLAWTLSILAAVGVLYGQQFEAMSLGGLLGVIALTVTAQAVAGYLTYLYRGRHLYGSLAEVDALFGASVIAALVGGSFVAVVGHQIRVPQSTVFLALPIAFLVMGAVRYSARRLNLMLARPPQEAEPALVLGAGYIGTTAVRRMITDPRSPYRPVGIIDDSPARRNTWVERVRVLGTRADLAEIARQTGAKVVIVAIARADASLLREVTDAASAAGLRTMVFPPLEEILSGKSRLRDLRDVSIEDLIGRHPVDTKIETIADYVTGKRVLVTGAGGSIGSELCRQLHGFRPAELIMLDHDETSLQATQIALYGRGLLDTDDVVLASIRDREAMTRLFEMRRPQVVFHAAALKHLPMLEQYPREAWQTNVEGTLNVLQAALAVDVEVFVTISTDKVANATSVLGKSKGVAERLTAWAAGRSTGRYLSVRFGNVIGSRGSMLPTFTALIEAGGPLTITHPDVTRYFMTIPEACQLVVQAGAIGRQGEVLILDMGEPVRILDIANRMIEMSGRDVAIVFTGLRSGEKLHEQLVGDGEVDHRPVHPLISHTAIAPLDPDDLDSERSWCS